MTETDFTVIENIKLCGDVFKMILKTENPQDVICGQFINISIPCRNDLILKRPFAVMDSDKGKKTVTICYKVVGKGTDSLSRLKGGEVLSGVYPLGNGFKLDGSHKTVLLLGGGIGIFPLFSVFKCYPDKKYHTILGFKNKESVVLSGDFEQFSKELLICTDDGSMGAKGFITDSLKRNIDRIKPDIILCCGPSQMYKPLKDFMSGYDIPVYVSLEERMACGIGACLVCNCAVTENGKQHYKRVCKDGPVFNLKEVAL
ncbi:MAG: dihydroorotate dehydrogenase electron transfer subunit [Clostridia bacterium]|nr:dihydroorotate dehydrogenase electron transfer subunit [Clostridia bacterium]